jgi:hypothetical protein
MKGKKIIAIILMLVFCIPLMPISQVGSLLSSNQLQEEINHPAAGKEIHAGSSDMIHQVVQLSAHIILPMQLPADERFTSRQADDIQTPPPNM